MNELAINGGEKAIKTDEPHDDRPFTTEEEIKAVARYLQKGGSKSIYGRSGIYQKFEDEFLEYHDMEYAVLTNSGTSALNSAFFAAGLEPGDEVIAPTYTFLATVMPIFQQNGFPVFADADPNTGNIEPKSIKKSITDQTEAIVVTHMWGHPVDMDPVIEIANEYDLTLIEDVSHAHGATYKNRLAGTMGDIACFSLGSTKLVSGGECGILITNNQEIYERATLVGHFRKRSEETVESEYYRRFCNVGYGQNYRAHPLAVVMADSQFSNIDEWIKTRQEKLMYLTDRLAEIPGVAPPVTRKNVTRGAFYGYKPAFVPQDFDCELNIEEYIRLLRAEGMDVKRPSSKPLHQLEFFQTHDDGYFARKHGNQWWKNHKRIYNDGDLTGAEQYYRNRLSLPTFTRQDKKLIDEYVTAFKKVHNNWSK